MKTWKSHKKFLWNFPRGTPNATVYRIEIVLVEKRYKQKTDWAEGPASPYHKTWKTFLQKVFPLLWDPHSSYFYWIHCLLCLLCIGQLFHHLSFSRLANLCFTCKQLATVILIFQGLSFIFSEGCGLYSSFQKIVWMENLKSHCIINKLKYNVCLRF